MIASAHRGFIETLKVCVLIVQANGAFDTYRSLYYDSGICSVYFLDNEVPASFTAAVLIKKRTLHQLPWAEVDIILQP
jgi:hypothetical protein